MKPIQGTGKRKTAIARATLSDGVGRITINKQLLDVWGHELARLRVQEPVILAGDIIKKLNIDVNVIGGGPSSQADAARLAIARALVKHSKKLEKTFLDYDRLLLVADIRRKEAVKPNRHGKARSKRQKSYR